MSLGLSHSLSRHKLKFSPDKIDTMIVQAIALLDDLDKELNTYAMRVKEWYGWHFPEMGRIVNDNLAYARVILNMGMRTNAANSDLAEILPEEIETAVKAAAEVSMGTEITNQDLENIQALAEQVVNFTEYRQQLSGYLSARMTAIAPNLTALVGDLVGARLIAHAGSLMNLAKSPASTIQILGAEKALFRALKTKHDTPKYGLIFHASLIGQATGKNKGKIARVLAAKAAIGLRVDALADWGEGDLVTEEEKAALGIESRLKVERRLATLEGKPLRPRGVAIAPNGVPNQPGKWEVKEARKYNPDADGLVGNEPAAVGTKKIVKSAAEIADVAMADAAQSSDDEDEEYGSGDDELVEENQPEQNGMKAASKSLKATATAAASGGDDAASDTLSTVSVDTSDAPDSPSQQETSWQSSILGDTKEAKKARKKERHERKLALSEERSKKKALENEKLARRLDRKERTIKKDEQVARRDERNREKYGALAEQAGLSIARFRRKLERGEIRFDEGGAPMSISKKEIKKAKKSEDNESSPAVSADKKKRKRDTDADEPEKKKKKSKDRA
jgi:nucleolar protein 58